MTASWWLTARTTAFRYSIPRGAYMDQWTGFRQPSDFFVDEDAGIIYLAEVGGRVSLLDLTGRTITSWGGPGRRAARPFSAPPRHLGRLRRRHLHGAKSQRDDAPLQVSAHRLTVKST